MEQKFYYHDETLPEQVAPEVTRRILAYSSKVMAVEMAFEAGAEGATHEHPHEQITYILSGMFSFTNDGETRDVRAGDSIRFAPGTRHGVVCIEKGGLLDVFVPCREDFLA